MILAADIGGTRCRFLLAETDGTIAAEAAYASAGFPNLEAAIDRFMDEHQTGRDHIELAALALAGPVTGDCVALTNLPWLVCRRALAQRLPKANILFVNDFQAAALGVLEVPPERLRPLRELPARPRARKLVLGAGTGLGVAYLHPAHGGHRAWPTEAGHMGFAPADALQWRLAEHLRRRHGRVSWERILSGPGLAELHAFLHGGAPVEPPAVIDAAAAGDSEAEATVALFVRLYGAFCGDAALAWQPAGGIYLTGGVTTHIAPWLDTAGFLEAYADKGRMASLVNRFPIHIVMEPRVGLLGALRHALDHQVTS